MHLSHIDEAGQARMVDVSAKPAVRRTARAEGTIRLQAATIELIRQNNIAKGDVLASARIAGIMGGKRTSELIPLCHNIEIEQLTVDLEVMADRIQIRTSATCTDKTGIEMEALTAASIAALTIYDMVKAVDKTMVIEGIRLVEKTKLARQGTFSLTSLNLSVQKGTKKTPADRLRLRVGHGIEGDAHAGPWHRQVSLLAEEAIDTMRSALPSLAPGDFAENLTTRGIQWQLLPVGTIVTIGQAELEITQIGKECHGAGCAIRAAVGDCVMPRLGVFARVTKSGEISHEDRGYYRF